MTTNNPAPLNLQFRNLIPEFDDSGQVIGADFSDVYVADTMLLSWRDVIHFVPPTLYRAIKAAALEQCRAALVDVVPVGPVLSSANARNRSVDSPRLM